MGKYIHIIRRKRRIHLYAAEGKSLFNASKKWLFNWDYFTKEDLKDIKSEFAINPELLLDPTPIAGVDNVWCDIVIAANKLFHVDIVACDEKKRYKKLTFVAHYDGGIYISQYLMDDVYKGLPLWAKNLSLEYFSEQEKEVIVNMCTKENILLSNEIESVWLYRFKVMTRKYMVLVVIATK